MPTRPPTAVRDYAIVLKRTNEFVGLVGLVPSMMPFALLDQYPRHPSDEAQSFNLAEVGLFWGVSSRHQRQGFATEAGAAMVAYGFGDWNLRRIVATTEHDNTAGVMRRLGMRIARNQAPTPFFLAVVGILENPNPPPSWQEWTAPPPPYGQ